MLVWMACSESRPEPRPDAGVPALACERREDCPGGQICAQEGFCVPCESSGQCRLKESCDAETRACTWRAGWGAECASNAECALGAWCRQGLCQSRTAVTLCPSGAREDCPTGQRCNLVNLVCEEDLGCLEDADCGATEVCNTGLHACVPRCTEATASTLCAAGERCAGSRCVQCVESDECGPGFLCDAAGRCAVTPRCYSDRDCRVPLTCHVPTGACLERSPPCTSDEGCASSQRCDIGTGACVSRTCQLDVLEPNDSAAEAFPVSASRYLDLTLCAGDVDHFAIMLQRGDQLGVNVEGDPFAESSFSTVILEGSGRVLASGHMLTSFVAASPGTYTVRASTLAPAQRYDVGFFLSRGTPCDDDRQEPNDTSATAKPYALGTTVEGVICPQDWDHFTLSVPEGHSARASLTNYSAASGLLRLCLFDGATELGCSEDPAGAVVSLPASVVGGKLLTARITGDAVRTTNGYTFQVELP
ncbi:hypothetical protein [Hyalangium sp.]|uniref:hypothetical protein n=1 Tax=Hyalangium sp. TaxID=2028555 RepID=UPI002D326676|nr:hypothetical protein [Hyalangium sp.]HYI01038.1 hypothetical protein [Hyalangium sp.]